MPAEARTVPAPAPETELLLLCARLKLQAAQAERLRALVEQQLDWVALLDAAWIHGLLPLLHSHLQAQLLLDALPPGPGQRLRQAFAENVRWNLRLSHELRELLDLFEHAGIPAIPYKGPVLAQRVYGSVALRVNGDLDIIVPRADVAGAHELLMARGYRFPHPLTPMQQQAVLRFEKSCEYVREPQRMVVELHWRLAEARSPVALDLDALRERCEWVPFAGTRVRDLARSDLLLLLCLHGCRHLWERLEWVCGVAELLRAGGWDWDGLLRQAERLGLRRMLLLGVVLAHELLEAPLPGGVVQLMRRDAELPALLEEVRGHVLARDERWSFSLGWSFHGFQLRLKERLGEKARYLYYALLAPAKEDWMALPLPDPLFPLYHLIRPIRLSGAYAQRLARIRR